MTGIKRKKCCNCKGLFIPDSRNAKRQKYCRKPECRKASKAASQKRWLAKPENQRAHCCIGTPFDKVICIVKKGKNWLTALRLCS